MTTLTPVSAIGEAGFAPNFLRRLRNILPSANDDVDDGFLLDLLVTCSGGDTVRASRLLLAAASPAVALALKDSDPFESSLIVPDVHASDLRLFLDCLVSEPTFTKEVSGALMKVCQHLQIDFQLSSSAIQPESGLEVGEIHDDEEEEEVEEGDSDDQSSFSATEVVDEINRRGPLACPLCGKVYRHSKARNRHLLSVHGGECARKGWYFKCGRCPQAFTSASGRERHWQRAHLRHMPRSNKVENVDEEGGSVSDRALCPFCQGTEVSSLKDLREHVKDRHPERDRCCIICGKDCAGKDELQKHIQEHNDDSPLSRLLFSCETCGLKFLSEYALVTHKKDEHSLNKKFECGHCGRCFRVEKHLRSHERKHDEEETALRCGHCARTFSNRQNLLRHVRDAHPVAPERKKRFRCEDCDKEFVDSTRLKQHRWIHTGYQPYKCDECEQGFRHVSHLRRHRARAHGHTKQERRFACPRCHRAFFYAYQLRTHINTTHRDDEDDDGRSSSMFARWKAGETPTATENPEAEAPPGDWLQTVYHCAICQATFGSAAELSSHSHLHNADAVGGGDESIRAVRGSAGEFVLEVPAGTEAAAAAVIAEAAGYATAAASGENVGNQGQFVIVYEDGNIMKQ